MEINVIQVNLDRSFAATGHLVKYVVDNKVDIALIQEPYCLQGRVVGFPANFTCFAFNSKAIVIVINKEISSSLITERCSDLTTTVLISFKNLTFIINSTYFPPTNNINDQICSLQSSVAGISCPLLFGLDRLDNSRGIVFLDFISSNDFNILNSNSPPTFEGHQGRSWIDLTVCNNLALNFIVNWKVLEDESLSYH